MADVTISCASHGEKQGDQRWLAERSTGNTRTTPALQQNSAVILAEELDTAGTGPAASLPSLAVGRPAAAAHNRRKLAAGPVGTPAAAPHSRKAAAADSDNSPVAPLRPVLLHDALAEAEARLPESQAMMLRRGFLVCRARP